MDDNTAVFLVNDYVSSALYLTTVLHPLLLAVTTGSFPVQPRPYSARGRQKKQLPKNTETLDCILMATIYPH